MIKPKVQETIKKFRLIPPHSKILVGLSGGPDSVTLLHVLLSLKEELGISVAAVHVNHMLRGEESERDEAFCRELCRKWKVELFVEKVNVPVISEGRNVEAVARRERYKVFGRVLKAWGGNLIAVAHTASDLVETILLNISKGTGLKGLRGFLPKRGNIVRPLFEVTREEVESYIKEHSLPFVIDSSNYSLNLERNLVRVKVVPELKRLNPSLELAFLRTASIIREVEDYISQEVSSIVSGFFKGERFCIPLEKAKVLHPYILSEVIREAYRKISGRELSFRKLSTVLSFLNSEGFKKFTPHTGYIIYKDQLSICIEKEKGKEAFSFEVKDLPATVETPAGKLVFELGKGTPILPTSDFQEKGIIVRNRRPGDKLLSGKSLKELLIEKKVPALERDRIPLVISGGKVVYVPGIYSPAGVEGNFVGVRFEGETEGFDRRDKAKEED
ncbi:MAG: tRNA lysidine(34) synthetase TilS [Desulfurobacteriaceae bacterium]